MDEDTINYKRCEDGVSAQVKRAEFLVFKSDDACLHVTSKDQIEYVRKILLALKGQGQGVAEIRVPYASWKDFNDVKGELEKHSISVHLTRGGQFGVRLLNLNNKSDVKAALKESGLPSDHFLYLNR